jgi:hypothetical protein
MGNLAISCEQTVEFMKQQKFAFMKSFKSFKFSPNTIKCKVKAFIFRPPLKVQLLSYNDGILNLKASTCDFVRLIVKIFIGIKGPIDELLEEEKLSEFIKRVNELHFEVDIAKLLEKFKIKGLTITNIEIKRKKLIIDFEVEDE